MNDFFTPAGIAVAVGIIMELIKKMVFPHIKATAKKSDDSAENKYYPLIMNVGAIIIALGISFLTLLRFPTPDLGTVILNGLMGGLMAIGGYEPIINLLRGIKGMIKK